MPPESQSERTTTADWAPPSEFEEYQLRHLLGRGRMGHVYLAYDTALARHVAVKFVQAVSPSATARERFLTEARAAARIQHPNVVAVYRVGELERHPYLVSELVRGQTLDKVPKPMAWPRVLEIGIELSRGLAAAHRGGVLHRDIKPQNAMLASDGHVKLLDFGLAKMDDEGGSGSKAVAPAQPSERVIDDPRATLAPDDERPQDAAAAWVLSVDALPVSREGSAPPSEMPEAQDASRITLVGTVMGTPDYMSPEAWRGESATRSSDVYSLGAVLYELCAGQLPHGRVRLRDLPEIVQAKDAPPLHGAAPSVDGRFGDIVDRCLRRDPAARFASGDELREALEDLARTTSSSGIPAGNPYRGLRPFEAEHRALFFGRADEVGVILDRLRSEAFVLLAGDSGVGKSSICRAGVLPLAARALEGGREWRATTLVPGRNPVTALAAALAGATGAREDDLAPLLARDPDLVVRNVRARLGESRGVLLFVDQLEELVTVSERAEATAADAFLVQLARGVPGFRLLATVRADMLTRVAGLPQLGEEIARALYLVRPLTAERVREVIVGPARATGIRFESDDLVGELVAATAHAEGGLPLLQFALTELWEARDRQRGVITRAALESIGGVAGALARHADALLTALRPAQRDAARRMLMRLVTLDGTRARRSESEITGGDPIARAALDTLVRGRIVVAHDAGGESAFEVAHEALIQGWETLRNWLHEDADKRVLVERLARAATDWDRLGRAREALWAGKQLLEAASVGLDELGPREAGFLQASRKAHRRVRRLRVAIALGLPLVIGAGIAALEVRSRYELDARVTRLLTAARGVLDKARAQSNVVSKLRQRAFASFDAWEREKGQNTFSSAQALADELDQRYGEAAQALEAALALDPKRPEVRGPMADVLLERALLAEQQRRPGRRDEYVRRLALYDDGGERRARWATPAALRVETTPDGAQVEVLRVQPDALGRLVERAETTLGPTPLRHTLAPGSYVLELRAPGRMLVRYAVQLARGESLALSIDLPRPEAVPAGFAYVPPGRLLFGSSADEALQRGFFDTVPIHPVRTGGYLIGRYEVTVAQWLEWLETLPDAERARRTPATEKAGFAGALRLERLAPLRWRYTLRSGGETFSAVTAEKLKFRGREVRAEQDWQRFPVTGISADDAQAYARWLDATGRVPGARLCTEYEWERGARGADDREFPHGQRLLREDANHDQTYGRRGAAMGPDEVGSHPASRSPFGLDDMAGNAFEWTTSSLAPGQFVGRGGSYFYDPKSNQIPNRQVSVATLREATTGMRLCATFPRGQQ